ncbi:MAG: nitroreductase family deazaflavin-dependent oxidoreductase [Anaerolineae bacterium]|nr:nitroreductase family deazaflavin-dependent oxidoreductase [Anaerolineae bacterium]
MPEKIRDLQPPTGLSRLFFRMPITAYKIGLGWLFGKRFLLLNHIGRKSGLTRQAVLEVVTHDKETDTYIIAVGFGKESQWYKNLMANPDVSIQVGRRKLDVHAEQLSHEEAGEILLAFAKKYPFEAKFVNVLGYTVDGTDDDWRALGKELTLIALRPR